MYSSISPISLNFPAKIPLQFHRFNVLTPNSLSNFIKPTNYKPSLGASFADRNLDLSWSDTGGPQDYNGWAIVESPSQKKPKGLPTFVLVGVGTSVVALLAAISCFSLSRKGFVFRLSSPFYALHENLMPSRTNERIESTYMSSDASVGDDMDDEALSEGVSDKANETLGVETNHLKKEEGKPRVIVPASVDPTQQEAVLLLKKLKIIEDDVKADELCSRREYARWLVQVNSLLERNPKHRIVSPLALSGSTFAAFDDVSVEDPDFISIQSLAEVGIVQSKLSGKNFGSNLGDSESLDGVKFLPDRFISRQDLIDWKVKLEYGVITGINEEISRNNLGLIDAREIRSDALVELFIDMLAGDKSIMRKVFGQSKRFQPSKPSTKAQAAVSLTSGGMRQAIMIELSRLEAENSSKQSAMKEIRSELLERGDIKRRWDRKMEEVKNYGLEMERIYLAVVNEFEQEKIAQESARSVYSKEKAAMDCQKQLLSRLKEEIDEMSERLACERADYVDEQHNIQSTLSESQVKYEEMLNAKSILQAEIEAVRILRSWVEDEARKSQARAKVLEEAGRRWKWEDHS